MQLLAETEGIIPALETAHAVAALPALCADLPSDAVVVLNCSGRGDKDMETIAARLGDERRAKGEEGTPERNASA